MVNQTLLLLLFYWCCCCCFIDAAAADVKGSFLSNCCCFSPSPPPLPLSLSLPHSAPTKGVNNDVEMMFMTGDRSSWIVLRQIDVTKKQTSTSKLNAQVLGSSDYSGSPEGSWINILMDPAVAADPKVGDTYWREDNSTVGLELKNAHKGIGVFVRNGNPRRCRITSGGGILSKNFEKKSSAGTLGRNGGGSTWPKGLLKLDSAASMATTCATTKTSTLIGQACEAVYKESTWQGSGVATVELCEAAIAIVCPNKNFFVYADGIGNDGSGNGDKPHWLPWIVFLHYFASCMYKHLFPIDIVLFLGLRFSLGSAICEHQLSEVVVGNIHVNAPGR